jgi:Uma2 family endonuclease
MVTVAARILRKRKPARLPATLADLLHQLGDIPPERIRLHPTPGHATEKHVIDALEAADKRLYELVDGVLVEKAMGTRESLLAAIIIQLMWNFVESHDLGIVLGGDGALRLMPGLVRIPDVSFIAWVKLPSREIPDTAIADLFPDLAVEVLSVSNTKREMERKLQDYFRVGVRLVWFIQPTTGTAEVYTSPMDVRHVGKAQALEGGDVLPGFKLPLRQLFARLKGRRGQRKRK